MMQVYDRVLATGGLATLTFVSIILLVALAVLAALDLIRARLLGRLSLRLDKLLGRTLLEAPMRRARAALDPRQAHSIRELDQIRQALTGPAALAVLDAPWAPVYVLVCFFIHPAIGALTLGGGAVLIFMAIANERSLRGAMDKTAELTPRLYAEQEADSAASDTVAALGMRQALVRRQLNRRVELQRVQMLAHFNAANHSSALKFLRLSLQSAALGVGAYLAVERQISPGALIAGSILATRAFSPLDQIVAAWRQLAQARNAYQLVRGVLAETENEIPRTELPAPRGTLTMERITVRLPGMERPALGDVSLALQPGEMLGVVGPSGAGKSTLARVAAGAISLQGSNVRIDGASFNDWEADALGRHIGYLPQELDLLAGTVAQNIQRFLPREDDAADLDKDTIEAATAAGAHEMILRLPAGYDTVLGPRGRGLSHGQAQRVALARALFRAPCLLVLDEPNAHLDAEGEAALIQALQNARARGAAILVTAHRAGLLNIADRLLVLRDGRMEALGARDDVMRALSAKAPA
jgi:ATP-binding cassette subfamily C protein